MHRIANLEIRVMMSSKCACQTGISLCCLNWRSISTCNEFRAAYGILRQYLLKEEGQHVQLPIYRWVITDGDNTIAFYPLRSPRGQMIDRRDTCCVAILSTRQHWPRKVTRSLFPASEGRVPKAGVQAENSGNRSNKSRLWDATGTSCKGFNTASHATKATEVDICHHMPAAKLPLQSFPELEARHLSVRPFPSNITNHCGGETLSRFCPAACLPGRN